MCLSWYHHSRKGATNPHTESRAQPFSVMPLAEMCVCVYTLQNHWLLCISLYWKLLSFDSGQTVPHYGKWDDASCVCFCFSSVFGWKVVLGHFCALGAFIIICSSYASSACIRWPWRSSVLTFIWRDRYEPLRVGSKVRQLLRKWLYIPVVDWNHYECIHCRSIVIRKNIVQCSDSTVHRFFERGGGVPLHVDWFCLGWCLGLIVVASLKCSRILSCIFFHRSLAFSRSITLFN